MKTEDMVALAQSVIADEPLEYVTWGAYEALQRQHNALVTQNIALQRRIDAMKSEIERARNDPSTRWPEMIYEVCFESWLDAIRDAGEMKS